MLIFNTYKLGVFTSENAVFDWLFVVVVELVLDVDAVVVAAVEVAAVVSVVVVEEEVGAFVWGRPMPNVLTKLGAVLRKVSMPCCICIIAFKALNQNKS